MTPSFKTSIDGAKKAMVTRLAEAMQSLEQALIVSADTGMAEDELLLLYKALAATLLAKIKAEKDAA